MLYMLVRRPFKVYRAMVNYLINSFDKEDATERASSTLEIDQK